MEGFRMSVASGHRVGLLATRAEQMRFAIGWMLLEERAKAKKLLLFVLRLGRSDDQDRSKR